MRKLGGGGNRARLRRSPPGANGFFGNLSRLSTSFYVTNIPVGIKESDLWEVYGKYGIVVDIFIPPKVDKHGQRFGFVRFKGVTDAHGFERKLEKVSVGGNKLRVNLARYNRGSKAEHFYDRKQTRASGLDKGGFVKENTSYANAVQPQNRRLGARLSNRWTPKAYLDVEVSEERAKSLATCLVGKLHEGVGDFEIQDHLFIEGYFEIKASPLGGDLVLLWPSEAGVLHEAVNGNRSWWSNRFQTFMNWEPTLLPKERLAWLRCVGVPLHIWDDKLFNVLAMKFGNLITIDKATSTMARCDVGRIQVSISAITSIDTTINLRVAGLVYPVRIMEERFGEIGHTFTAPERGSAMGSISSSSCSGHWSAAEATVLGLTDAGSDGDDLEVEQRVHELYGTSSSTIGYNLSRSAVMETDLNRHTRERNWLNNGFCRDAVEVQRLDDAQLPLGQPTPKSKRSLEEVGLLGSGSRVSARETATRHYPVVNVEKGDNALVLQRMKEVLLLKFLVGTWVEGRVGLVTDWITWAQEWASNTGL